MKVVTIKDGETARKGAGAGEDVSDEGYLTLGDLVAEPGLTAEELDRARKWWQGLEPVPPPPSKEKGNLRMLAGGLTGDPRVIDEFREAIEDLPWSELTGYAIILITADGATCTSYSAPWNFARMLGAVDILRERLHRDHDYSND